MNQLFKTDVAVAATDKKRVPDVTFLEKESAAGGTDRPNDMDRKDQAQHGPREQNLQDEITVTKK